MNDKLNGFNNGMNTIDGVGDVPGIGGTSFKITLSQHGLWEESKYFTPDIKDIHIGYECETTNNRKDWFSWKFESYNFSALEIELQNGAYRTPYLTKEQIEREGWTYKGKVFDVWFERNLDYSMGNWSVNKLGLKYDSEFKKLQIYAIDLIDGLEYILYRGNCKDINTLRKIQKLLEI